MDQAASVSFYGDVTYVPQNRFKAYDRSNNGLGSVRPVLSGGYRAALGKVVRPGMASARQQDYNMFARMGIRPAGVGGGGLGATDREICSILTSTAGALTSGVTQAALGSRPTQRSGETAADFQRRVNDWDAQTRVGNTAGTSLTTASRLCDLIDQTDTSVGNNPGTQGGPSAWELAQARSELARLYAAQGSPPPATNWQPIAIGVGLLAVVGLGAYVLLK